MFFARFSNKRGLVLGAVIFLVILALAFFVGYSLGDYGNTDKDNQETTSQTGLEVKILRTQEEIATSYKGSMERAIDRLNKAGSREDVVSVSENMFFDIYVPTDLRDMHVEKLLEANKLLEDTSLNKEGLKEKLIYIINELLAENQKIIENI